MNESWGSRESRLNQIGTVLVIFPALLLAMLLYVGVIPLTAPAGVLFGAVAACGAVGGGLNLSGRGPVAIGALVGLAIALGGYGAVYGWLHVRASSYWIEIALVYFAGTLPGFLLQRALQPLVLQRDGPT